MEEKDIFISFAKDKWDPNEWLKVRSPRWVETSHWIQDEDGIRNHLPDDLRPEEMQMGRGRTGESYISMLYKKPFHDNYHFALECAFIDRMAPLMVLSPTLRPIHEDHIEIVLYDCGINVWHHYWVDAKPSWKILSFIDLKLTQGERYKMEVEVFHNKKGSLLQINCNNNSFGTRLDCDWFKEYYAGFTGCEGKNKFYSFEAKKSIIQSGVMKERFSD